MLTIALAALAIWAAAGLWLEFRGAARPVGRASAPLAHEQEERAHAELVRVVDGDTIVAHLGGVEERIRYIGMDTPELHHPRMPVMPLAREAKKANEALLGGGSIELAFDAEERDRYGRLLAYVFVIPDARRSPHNASPVFVNLRLIEMGLARCYTFPPNVAHVDEFVAAQRKARAKGLGIWRDYDASFGKPFDESNPQGRYRRR
jgi:micrococcal nuclease